MFDALKALQTEKEAYEAKMKAAGGEAVKAAIREFMTACPEVKRLRWTQYTPYFNDGDECVFGLHGVYVDIGKPDEGEGGWLDEYSLPKGSPVRGMLDKFERAIGIMEDALKVAFGDHAEITVTPEAITVEQYDHE